MSGMFRFRGINPRGQPVQGQFAVANNSLPALIEDYFRYGWRSLRVCAGNGPVPPSFAEQPVGGIGPHPDTGKRVWWAES